VAVSDGSVLRRIAGVLATASAVASAACSGNVIEAPASSSPVGASSGSSPGPILGVGARDEIQAMATAGAQRLCAGDCTEIQASATGSTEDYEYSWNEGLPAGPGPFRVCPQSSTEYVVAVTAISGKEIRASQSAMASVSVEVLACSGGSLSGAGGGGSFGGTSGLSPGGASSAGGGASSAGGGAPSAGGAPSLGGDAGASPAGAAGSSPSSGGASSGGAGGSSGDDAPPRTATILCQAKLSLAPEPNAGNGDIVRNGDNMYKSPDLATDAAGNIFMTGSFTGTINTGVGTLGARGSDWAAFIVKFTPDCKPSWAHVYGSLGARVDMGPIAVASTGEIVLGGEFSQATVPVDFGAGPLSSPQGVRAAFLLKLRPDGTTALSKAYTVTQQGYADVNGLSLDGADNIVLIGEISDPKTFGAPVIDANLGGNYVAKFKLDGTPLWTRLGPMFAMFDEVHATRSGLLYLIGGSSMGVDWGSGDMLGPLSSSFISQLDANGAHQWDRSVNSTMVGTWGATADVDTSDNAIVASGTVNSSNTQLATRTLSMIAPNGTWSPPVKWTAEDGASIAGWMRVTGSGRFIEVGQLFQPMHIGGTLLTPNGGEDVYVVERDANGRAIWVDKQGGADPDVPLGLATDTQGNGIVSYFTERDQPNDVFLVKYAP
jgi:hypothetical protein